MKSFKASVVAKLKDKWFIGFIKGNRFIIKKEVSKLSDVKEASSYVGLKTWLKRKDRDVKLAEKILKKHKASSMYILEKPIEPTDEEFENYWWDTINKKCQKCQGECKQSSKVIIERCKLYKKI
jgi:hypothetical protein